MDKRKNSLTSIGYPVVFYATQSGEKPKMFQTGYHSFEKDWNDNKELPKASHPDFTNLINYIELKNIVINKVLFRSRVEYLSLEQAKDIILSKDKSVFYKDAQKLDLPKSYLAALELFQREFPNYSYNSITSKVANRFLNILAASEYKGKKRSNNGINIYLGMLNSIWNKLGKDNSPFSGVRLPAQTTKNKAHSDSDMIKIINHTLPTNNKGTGTGDYLNYLLICFYLGGVDMWELVNFTYSENVVDGRLEFIRYKPKAKQQISNVILPQAKELLDMYKTGDSFIPINDRNKYRTFVNYLSAKKWGEIKKELALSKKPYTKAARFTFINRAKQLLIEKRISEEIVGHESGKSTHDIYGSELPYSIRDKAHKKIIDFNHIAP